MDADQPAVASGATDWEFSTLAYLWDAASKAIMAGGGRLESLADDHRTRSLSAAVFMVDDLHKSCFREFRWSSAVDQYIGATAGTFTQELTRRGYALHYVVDNTQREDSFADVPDCASAIFSSAGMLVTGPQAMAFELMDRADRQPRDVTALARYRDEGHFVADKLIDRCHTERRHSAHFNLDFDDDKPPLALDVALSPAGAPGTILIFRNQAPVTGSIAQVVPPPGVTLPDFK